MKGFAILLAEAVMFVAYYSLILATLMTIESQQELRVSTFDPHPHNMDGYDSLALRGNFPLFHLRPGGIMT
ncbi:hypothetical protein BJ878DRAFT_278755 [Calycina marina]|uniref:Uncharacterized protein n=1 Tax=Calycina marina TaxID=1763456 RepID=A0A9P8CBH7_9HELO|nr:hypothetical protein BJ878DRAFT_278755 [Calycina marina]